MSTPRRIVSDTGPLISLEKLTGGFQFIRKLYDTVMIPPAVLRELAQGRFQSTGAYLAHYDVADLLEIKNVSPPNIDPELDHLDEGESQAIQLALGEGLPLLIEEQAGRKIAQELGVHISGIAGQLRKGWKEGAISADEAKFNLDELLRAGRINTKVYEIIVQAIETES